MASPGHESESKHLLDAQLRATLDVIPAYTWYANPSGGLTFVNERLSDYLGLPKDHPLRLGIDMGAEWDAHTPLLHPDDRDETRRIWSTCLSTGCAGEASFRVRNAEGGYRWFLSRTEPLRASDGTLLYWIGVNLEIEERKQAEFYLAEGERLAHMGSWVLHPAGFFPYWSRELFHIYSLDPAKEGPSLEEYLAIVHPQDREFMRSLIDRMFAEATGCDVTKRIVRPDDEVRYVRCVAVPIVENGVLKRIVGTAMDVTEHEHLTQELQRREAYLAEAQKLSHTGSFGWTVQTGEIVWSDETFRIFEFDPSVKPTLELILGRLHPDDRARLQQIIDRAPLGQDFEIEYRLLMPDGRVKYLHILAHALTRSSGDLEFVGAVTDVTEAKQTEDRIRRIINTVPGLHWSARPDGWVDFINQRWLDYTGMTLEQALGWGWAPAYHPDEIEEVQVKWRTAVAEGKPLEMETRLRRFDGEYRWFLERVFPLFDHAGQILGWYGSDIDIHDRKQAEDKIRQQEIEVRQIVDLAPQLVSVFGPGRERLYANRVVLDYLGVGLDEWLQRSPGTHIHPDDSERMKACWDRALGSGSGFDVELRLRKHDGSYRWFLARYNPVHDDKGQIMRWYVAGTDIEERKRAEEKLQQENAALMRAEQKIREQEAELRQMLDFTPQYLAVLGADGTPIYANSASLDYIGMRLDEWLQRKQIGEEVHPDDLKRLISELDRALSTGSPVEIEERVRKGDGSFRWCLTRCNPVRDENGQITRLYLASTDIHDRKSAEERLQRENVALREEIEKTSMFEEIVGSSPALQAVLSHVSKVAPTDSTVLITGETGTGKELVARAIHRRSQRSSRAFVSVNCAAIPRDLIASELFGHEKGSFTGATQQRLGRFELAGGGTIFLDEVGELPAETQIALLRVLQEQEFERVGGTRSIRTDVRVIAATNRDLQAAIAAGTFRNDLFYRLNVFPIEIPPLRQRRQDIPLLVEYFIDRYARKAGKIIRGLNKNSLERLQSYPWPGNIRELQNIIERSVIVCETENFSVDESWLSRQPLATEQKSQVDLSEKLAAQEKEMIEAALRESGGRVYGPSGAAAKLGMPRSTLESKIRSLKIDKNRFRTAVPSEST
jgi:formate hydrogenlyase transcriptional activator